MKKRVWALLLAVMMVVSVLPTGVFADEEATPPAETALQPGDVKATKTLQSQEPDASGNYTIVLTVQGKNATENVKPNADVVLVVDNSGSMASKVGEPCTATKADIEKHGETRKISSLLQSTSVTWTTYTCPVCGANYYKMQWSFAWGLFKGEEYSNVPEKCEGETGETSPRIDTAKQVGKAFAESVLTEGSGNKVAVIGFSSMNVNGGSDDTEAINVSQELTSTLADVKTAIEKMKADGGTNYSAALQKAYDYLNSRSDKTRPGYVIFITDGAPGRSGESWNDKNWNGSEQFDALKKAKITVYTVGVALKESDNGYQYLKGLKENGKTDEFINVYGSNYADQLSAIMVKWGSEINSVPAGTGAVLTDVVDTSKFEVVSYDTAKLTRTDDAEANTATFIWTIGNIPETKQTATIVIKPKDGVYGDDIPTNTNVELTYKDPDDDEQTITKEQIGDPKVTIADPTPTPTDPTPVEVDLNGKDNAGLIFKTLTSESGAYKKDGHAFTVTVDPITPVGNDTFKKYTGSAVKGDVTVYDGNKTAFTFEDKLTFSAAGTYKFTVAETKGDESNINYDETTYTMQITVAEDETENKLEVTEIKFFENSKDSIEITPITPITLSLEVPSDGFVKPEPTPTPTPNPALYSGYTVTFKNTLKMDGQAPNKDPDPIEPTIKADLSVTKTVDGVYYRGADTNLVKREDGAAAQAGDTVRWTITVKNSGRAPGKFTLNDQFDGVVTNDDEIKIYDAEGNQVTGQQTIGKGATILYTAEYVVKATDIGKTLVNQVTLVSDKEGVTDPSDTADGVETAGLSVEKRIKEIYDPTDPNRDGHYDPVVGDRIAYTITVKNIGSADLSGIKVQDTMIGAGTLSVSAEDKAVWESGFDLKAGESRTFEVEYQTVMADRDTEVYNTVVVGTEVNNDGNLKPMAEAESEKVKVKVVPTPATFDPNNPTNAEKGEEQPLLWKSFTYKDNSANFPDGHMATFEALITPVTGEGLTEYNGKPVKGYVRYIESNNADWHDLGKTMKFQYYADVDKDYTDVLTFTEPGTYVFDVFENIPNVEYRIDGVEYDETHYTLTVTVEPDENNDLVVSDWTLAPVVKEDMEPYTVEFAIFNNTYDKEKEKEDKPNTITPVGPSVTPKLNREDHYAYIVGMPDGLVHPEQNITRAEVATIFFRMLLDESRDYWWCQTNSFSDVAEDAWYNNAISTLTNAGLLNGYPDGRFGPNDNITRAEFAAIAVRFFTDEAEDVKITGDAFPDIAKSWANYEINLAYALDLVQGTGEGTFEPDRQITRAEAMTIVNRVLKRAPEKDHLLDDMIEWPDNMNTRAWYYAAVQEATNSHEYYKTKNKSGDEYEVWTELKEVRDWVALEKEWSNAHSSDNPGEVVSKGTETPEPSKGGKLTVD